MGWDDVLAAVGGGAEQLGKSQQFQANLKKQEDIAQLHADLQMLAEVGRNTRAEGANATRVDIADKGNDTKRDIADGANATRQTIADASNATKTSIADAGNTTRRDIAAGANTSREGIASKRLDFDLSKYWDGTNPLAWSGQAETARRDNMNSADRRFSTATSAATAARGQDVTQRGQNLSDQRGRAGLQIRQDQNWFAPAGAAKIDLANPDSGDTKPVPAPVPVAPRGSSSAAPAGAPAAAAPKLPAGLVVGATITLNDGSKHVVKAIDPVTGDVSY